jgi:hypothetical protein
MTDGIPWDREVEIFQVRGRQADLRVTRTKMPLREALNGGTFHRAAACRLRT